MNTQMMIEIVIRTILSMIIGGLIGWERESTHRPAGLRTHMLVAVGACVIMQLGIFTATQYGNLDPTRLGAQVISGIGFLGAGTIMKEGASVKGLTTAASLWAVACLGLAVGCGAYFIAIVGFVAIILTLTVFERASNYVPDGKYTRLTISIRCEDISQTLVHLNVIAEKHQAQILELQLKVIEEHNNKITFKLATNKSRRRLDSTELMGNISQYSGINTVKMTEC